MLDGEKSRCAREHPAAKTENGCAFNRRYAGFWMRFWAYLIDLIVVFSINGILLSPIKWLTDGGDMAIGLWTVYGLCGSAIFYLYFALMTKACGQTLGKMIFGLRVIRMNGESLRWSDLLFREIIGRFIHRVLWILYVAVAFTDEKAGVHDMIADTRVIHTDSTDV
ncbi:MAG TPA: RDD family protein [Bacillota bacterium]|nr:RDD family protein [Bacillota bacterium]